MRAPSSRRTPSHRNRSLALTLALGLGARAGCTPATADRPLIVVTTNILGDVVENIVGDQVEVMTLMRPNSDPHSFEISAQEAARILSADLVISNGLGPEEGLQKQLDSATDAGVPMLAAGEIIETLAYTSTASDTGADDPHFWTDPERMLDVVAAVTGAVRDEVAGVDTGAIDQSAAAYTAELEALDTEMTDRFAGIRAERRNLVTNHHVFGYLADRFDFTVVGAVIPGGSTLAAPSASDLRSLVDAIDTAGVPTIFAESSQPDRLVQVLADEAGLDVAVVELFTESLSEAGGDADTYLTMKEKMKTQHRTTAFAAIIAASALLLSACAPADETPTGSSSPAAAATPRVSLTYDGGLLVLDGTTLDIEADLPLAGFNRVNTAGDGRHVLVTTADGFRVLDTGTWTADGVSETAEPVLTDLVLDAPAAGHVVKHGDKTILYADGTGDTTIYETAALLASPDTLPQTEVIPAEAAHHGVSIELEDGTLLTTVGTEEARTGIRVLNADREEIDRNDDCPSVHGEGAAANEVSMFGCSNGVLLYDQGEITKITAPDAYGRTGNAYVTETSTIAVGDYNSNPDSEGSLLSEILLVDTVAKTAEVIDLPDGIQYTWRDVARTADDGALILGTDGALHAMDPETGELTDSFPVISAWEGPAEWQDAHPALTVVGGTAYVTEPATDSVFAVDVATGKVTASAGLPGTPNEIAVVTG